MKSKSILLMALLSATVAAMSCNNSSATSYAEEDGYNETVVKDIKANHPEDFQTEKQIHQVLKGSTRIATNL